MTEKGEEQLTIVRTLPIIAEVLLRGREDTGSDDTGLGECAARGDSYKEAAAVDDCILIE